MQSKEWNIYRIISHFIFRSWSRTNTYLYPPHSATDCHLVYRHNIPFVGLSDTFHSFSQCVPGTLRVRQKSIAWKFLRKPDIFQLRGKWMKLYGQWCKLILWIINERSLVTVLLLLWQLSEGKMFCLFNLPHQKFICKCCCLFTARSDQLLSRQRISL